MHSATCKWNNAKGTARDRPHSLLVSLSPCLLAFSLLGIGTSAVVDPQQLLQEGHAAFDRGDYASAAALYERAEIHSTDPAQVAFYLAGAKYHLALKTDGPSSELQEAERLYRCCLDPADPRRPLALYGLGNCLLLRAGQRDAGSLRTAIACFDQCLQSIAGDEPLAADARYNREKARLMLLQLQPQARGAEGDKPPGNDTNLPPPRDDPRQLAATVGEQGTEGTAEKRAVGDSARPEPGANATKTDMPPPPGKGNLDPIPDEADAPPLSPRDAAEHLEAATRKVMKERQTHHRRSDRPSGAGMKDW